MNGPSASESSSSSPSAAAAAAAAVSPPSVDLEAWAGRYEGETRLQRLLFWAHHGSLRPEQRAWASQLALQHIESVGGHLDQYARLVSAVSSTATTAASQQQQQDWMRQQEQLLQAQRNTLETRLSNAQAHLHKDAIRTAHLELASFHHQRGALPEALQSVLRSRDYCTTRAQTGQVCLLVIELALDMKNWKLVREYAGKAKHATLAPGEDVKLHVALGLSYLSDAKFHEAANAFSQVSSPPPAWNQVVAPQDVALYTAVLALSCFSRSKLQQLLEQASHLELMPAMQQALRHICVRADYQACLQELAAQRCVMDLDWYLYPHVAVLLARIQDRCLVDHVRPLSRVSLSDMARKFGGMDPTVLQSQLAHLIGQGRVPHARLDGRSNTLTKSVTLQQQAQWRETQERVKSLEQSVLNDAYSMVVRLACLENHRGEGGGGRRGGDAGASAPRHEVGWSDDDEDDDDDDEEMQDFVLTNVAAAAAAANPEDGAEERGML